MKLIFSEFELCLNAMQWEKQTNLAHSVESTKSYIKKVNHSFQWVYATNLYSLMTTPSIFDPGIRITNSIIIEKGSTTKWQTIYSLQRDFIQK